MSANKYNARRKNGYDSILESDVAAILYKNLPQGCVHDQHEVILLGASQWHKQMTHKVDFLITHPHRDDFLYIEAKGQVLRDYQLLSKVWGAIHPDEYSHLVLVGNVKPPDNRRNFLRKVPRYVALRNFELWLVQWLNGDHVQQQLEVKLNGLG